MNSRLGIFLKSLSFLETKVRFCEREVAAIIASGNFIRLVFLSSTVLFFIEGFNSMTLEWEIKLFKISSSCSVGVFQQSNSISEITEMEGGESCKMVSINFSASGGNCC